MPPLPPSDRWSEFPAPSVRSFVPVDQKISFAGSTIERIRHLTAFTLHLAFIRVGRHMNRLTENDGSAAEGEVDRCPVPSVLQDPATAGGYRHGHNRPT